MRTACLWGCELHSGRTVWGHPRPGGSEKHGGFAVSPKVVSKGQLGFRMMKKGTRMQAT